MNTKLVAFGLIIALVLSAGMASALSNSGGGDWKYYKEVTIKENSGKTLSDYQVLVELNPPNFPDNAKSDGSDLRFAEDGKELSYWIEDYDAGAKTTKIWVKVPSIPAKGEAKIKMFYGNEKAGSVSDEDEVFELFDDYTDEPKWADGLTTVTVEQNLLRFHSDSLPNGPLAYREFNTINYDVVVEWKAQEHDSYTDSDKPNEMFYIIGGKEEDNRVAQIVFYPEKGTNPCNPFKSRGISVVSQGDKMFYDKPDFYHWYIFKTNIKLSEHHLDYFVYDEEYSLLSTAYNKNFPDAAMNSFNRFYFGDGTCGGITDNYVKWIRVRKYAALEPTIFLSAEYPTKKIPSPTLTKSASPSTIQEGETTTISTRIENTGAGDAKSVEVTDTIPMGFKIISGSKSESFGEIKSGDYRTFEYTLKATETGKFTCDPATATYKDADGNSYSAVSNSVSIQVGGEVPVGADSDGDGWSDEKEKEMGTNPYSVDSDGDGMKDPEDPNPTVSEEKEKTPGFEAVFAIAGLLAVAYLLRRRG